MMLDYLDSAGLQATRVTLADEAQLQWHQKRIQHADERRLRQFIMGASLCLRIAYLRRGRVERSGQVDAAGVDGQPVAKGVFICRL